MTLGTAAQMMPEERLLSAEELRSEVRDLLPFAPEWLNTPHDLLGGDTPEQRIAAGDREAVQNLLYSIFFVGSV